MSQSESRIKSFNTQPPEGGCNAKSELLTASYSFNTQPPEGGCYNKLFVI